MKLDLDREDLVALVKGIELNYSEFENKLVKKAKHIYNDHNGVSNWYGLSKLTDEELYVLYLICKNSFNN